MPRLRDILGLMGLIFVLGITLGYALGHGKKPSPDVRSGSLALLDSYKSQDSRRYCFEFDRPLAERTDAEWKAAIKVEPEASFQVERSGRDLCLDGFRTGTYKIILPSGLAASDGTTLRKPETREIAFGSQTPQVSFASRGFILPRAGTIGLPIETVNVEKVHVTITRIADRDLAQEMVATWWKGPLSSWEKGKFSRAATVVWEGSLEVLDLRPDTRVTTSLPLSEVLPNRLPGAYLVEVRPWSHEKAHYWGSDEAKASQWVIDSDLTLTTFQGEQGVVAVARSLDRAMAVAGVDLVLLSENGGELARARTDASGRGNFPAGVLRGTGDRSPRVIQAFGPDGDFSVHDLTRPAFDLSDRGVGGRPAPGPLDSFAWTDRGIYRPGETVHLSVLMRDRLGKATDAPVRVKFRRSDGSEWMERLATPDSGGGAHLSVELPPRAKLGGWLAEIRSDPGAPPTGRVAFEVQDFVPRTLAVTAGADKPVVEMDERVEVNLHADWLYGAPGGGLGAEVTGKLEIAADAFSKLKGWRFGRHDEKFMAEEVTFPEQTTDAEGNATIASSVGRKSSSHPLQLRIETAVFESGGRPNPGTALVLPVVTAPFHIGLRPQFEGGRVLNGTVAAIEVQAFDRAGTVAGDRKLRWQLIEEHWHYLWSREDGHWRTKVSVDDRPLDSGEVVSTDKPVVLKFPTQAWSRYRLVVDAADGGAPVSMRYASGWNQSAEDGDETPDMVSVVPDKDRYRVGEVAHVTIKPQFDGQALVAVAAGTITETREVAVSPQGTVVDIPVSTDWGAGAYVTVNVHRPLKGEGARGAIRAVGVAWVPVDNSARTLAVEVKAPELLRPQTRASVPVKVSGAAMDSPAYLTLAAVDEGILAITDFATPSPDQHYFGKRRLGIDLRDDYGRLIDGRAGPAGRMRQGGDSSGARGLSVTPTRTVALFSGPIQVAADGSATVEFDIPDFSGKLRLMAVAYSPEAVGHGEAASVIRSPVVADAYLPRFLASGDDASVAVNLNNIEGRKGPFHLDLESAGPITLAGKASFDLDLANGAPRTESVKITATGMGIGSVSLRLTGPEGLDIRRSWPIQSRTAHLPLATEQTAPLAAGESFIVPSDLAGSFLPGSLRVGLGFGYVKGIDVPGLLSKLDHYPYGCTEQTTSRAMPLLSFDGPALLASGAGTLGSPELRARVQKAVDVLVDRQGEDGRIGLWRRGDGLSSSWLNVFASDFLLQAKHRGYILSDEATGRTMNWLKQFAGNSWGAGTGADWNRENVQAARAYAIYVLARNRSPNPNAMTDLARAESMPAVARAMLGAALAMSGRTAEADKAFAAVEVRLGADDDNLALYGSKLRDTAAFLALSVESRPGFDASALLDRVAQLSTGQETSTQEKTWLLRAASALVRDEPVEIGIQAEGQPAQPPVTRRNLVLTPTATQIAGGYVVTNRGKQMLYRTLSVEGVPKTSPPPSADGFKLGKQWFTLDGESVDITSATIAQHDRLVVKIDGRAQDQRYRQAMVVDLLPAGFQIEHILMPPAKAKEDDKAASRNRFAWLGTLTRPSMHEARDDRMVAAVTVNEPRSMFGWRFLDDDEEDDDHVQAGQDFTVAYVVRAVTPGRFALPAASVEDMYRPSVRARTAGGTVEIVRK
jgi:uncharacterized protein YfaS (alpha-2-macroglobulin family)